MPYPHWPHGYTVMNPCLATNQGHSCLAKLLLPPMGAAFRASSCRGRAGPAHGRAVMWLILGPSQQHMPVVASQVRAHPAICACSFRGDQLSRPRWASRMGALSWGLDLATFEGVPVRLHGFEMANVAMLSSVFVGQLMRQVRARPSQHR